MLHMIRRLAAVWSNSEQRAPPFSVHMLTEEKGPRVSNYHLGINDGQYEPNPRMMGGSVEQLPDLEKGT